MHRRPIVRIGRLNDHIAVEPHLLAIVLTDVRVVPVDARIGERNVSRELLTDLHWLLGLMCPVVPVLEAQPVPMHGRLKVALVLDGDHDLRSLANAQSGTRY